MLIDFGTQLQKSIYVKYFSEKEALHILAFRKQNLSQFKALLSRAVMTEGSVEEKKKFGLGVT